ncbi:MAG: family phage major capsid protein [Microvirga sp.]|nr:family phage major capsid protein [Microvirga sp.]
MNRLETKADLSVDEAGTITGLAWPFGEADRVGDVIEPGAFRFPSTLPILSEHDQSQVIGVWESAEETDAGLVVKGRLFVEGVEPARAARERIRKGIVGGLSISFRHDGFERLPSGGRKFSDISVSEISICRRPVHPGARILEVKSEPQQESSMEPEVQTEPEAGDNVELKALNDNFTKLTARLDQMERRLSRPNLAGDKDRDEPSIERKAFASYLRHGDRTPEIELKALSVTSDTHGGYFAPPEMSSEFIRDLVEWSPIRTIASVRTTSAPAVTYPKRTGITNARYVGENEEQTESEPTFGQVSVRIREASTYVDVSNQLLADAGTIESEVRLALAEDFGKLEGEKFVHGDGVLEPEGLLTATGIAETLNGHATNLSADQLITLMYALPAAYRARGSWLMNGGTLAKLRTLKDGQGNYLWQPSYQAGQPEMILGRPVVEAVDMPDVAANAFPIMFGDFAAGYRIVDRVADLQVLVNPYIIATTSQTRIHAWRRHGARVIQPAALRKLKMATS